MTDSSEIPEGLRHLVPTTRIGASGGAIPALRASDAGLTLSRRELRMRELAQSVTAASITPAVAPAAETRRERRMRELAGMSAAASALSEAPAAEITTPAVLAPAVPTVAAVTDAIATTVAPTVSVPTVSVPTVSESISAAPSNSVPTARVAEPVAAPRTDSRMERLTGATEPRRAGASVRHTGQELAARPNHTHRGAGPRDRKRTIASTVVMVATAGLVATLALPAYAYSDSNSVTNANLAASSQLGIQSLTVAGVNGQTSLRDGYTTTGDIAAMDSTTGSTVSPTVQALAAELVADVAAGKLVGSVPDHIKEIRNLANGQAVNGCGVDYRVLQTIKVAVDNFSKVGVSDINRHCTGQIEGAGTASSHYANGGGHAVDFYILNGHGLTGADADSLKLIRLLDPLVPPGTNVGQAECGRSISLTNMVQFDDTCTHLHIDFGAARGVSLSN